MDFPDLVAGGKSLYLTANIISASDEIALMTRTSLAALQSGNVTVTYFTWDPNSHFRIARNCQARLFWGAHNTESQMRIFTWDEGTTTVSWHDVDVSSWNSNEAEAYPVPLPDGVVWDNIHSWLLGATKAGNNLVFAWTAGRDGTNVPEKERMLQPYIQMAIIDTTSFTLTGENYIWQPENAFAVPALATNANDEVGISLGWGGPNRYVNNVVGIVTGTAEYIETTNATRSSTSWGHYVSVHQGYPNQEQFVASGFAILSDHVDPQVALGDPHYIVFGRSGV
jgi:hypothetical protein